MSGVRRRHPPPITLSILNEKYEKYAKIYKYGGANIFQKSNVNQPNQGHQPWQSNSLHLHISDVASITPSLIRDGAGGYMKIL